MVAGKEIRKLLPVADGRDRVQLGLDRREAGGLDRRLVHERGVPVAHFPAVAPLGGAGVRCGFDQDGPHLLQRLVLERRQSTRFDPVSGNLGALDPLPIDVPEEVVARLDPGIHAGKVDAPRAVLGLPGCTTRCGRGWGGIRRHCLGGGGRDGEGRRKRGCKCETFHCDPFRDWIEGCVVKFDGPQDGGIHAATRTVTS